jgi:3-phenylpropionate/trans-cinnamate dioxygenase ferredoxin reductase component
MSEQTRVVIIGAGIAGINAAKTLRDNQFKGEITLIDGDSNLPYDRPPLSKEFIAGVMVEDDILLHPATFYQDNQIDLRLGNKVIEIQPTKKELTLDNRDIIHWDKLLITTGSKLRRLQNLDDLNFENVFYLKTLRDADYLKEKLASLNHLVIIGAGFIGLEVAASLVALGKKVTVFEAAKTPLTRVLGEDMGNYIADVHRSKGIEIYTDDYITNFIGDTNLKKIETKDGIKLECDGILVGIGVTPDSLLSEGILDYEDGIVIDEFCETSVSNIYAAGDCARWTYSVSGEKIRIEHWDHALNQGRNAAINMLNPKSETYETIPYFWSNQHHLAIQYLGHPTQWDQTVLRGQLEKDQFTMFYLLGNTVVGALIVNQPKNVLPIRRLINQKIAVNAEELGDETKKLRDFVKQKTLAK